MQCVVVSIRVPNTDQLCQIRMFGDSSNSHKFGISFPFCFLHSVVILCLEGSSILVKINLEGKCY
jgi:hypothetical protein